MVPCSPCAAIPCESYSVVSNLMAHLTRYPIKTDIDLLALTGSLLLCLLIAQICSGLLLTCYSSLVDVYYGWFILALHQTGAHGLFILLFVHLVRGLDQNGTAKNLGVVLLVLMLIEGFLGYILPWGNMSYWALVVGLGAVASIPVIGDPLAKLIWGHSSLVVPKIFTLHFLLGLIILLIVLLHINAVHHTSGSSVWQDSFESVWGKDLFYWSLALGVLFVYATHGPSVHAPLSLLQAPLHIRPEWYLLVPFAILKAFPSKAMGLWIIVLLISLL